MYIYEYLGSVLQITEISLRIPKVHLKSERCIPNLSKVLGTRNISSEERRTIYYQSFDISMNAEQFFTDEVGT